MTLLQHPRGVAREVQALSDRRTALVTGATDGIGLTTATNLAERGYRVLVHGRDAERIKSACGKVREAAGGKFSSAVPIMADLSTYRGCLGLVTAVKTACIDIDRNGVQELNVIVNNAGVFTTGNGRKTVPWDVSNTFEETFAVNVVAPFVVTSLLLPLLTVQDGTRIIITSSISQCGSIGDWNDLNFERRSFSNHRAYSESKLLDAMLSMEFAHRLTGAGFTTDRVTCNTLDPGTVNTKMLLAGWGAIGINVEHALDEAWLATSNEVAGETGKYYTYRSERRAASSAYDRKERSKLWKTLSALAPDAVAQWESLST